MYNIYDIMVFVLGGFIVYVNNYILIPIIHNFGQTQIFMTDVYLIVHGIYFFFLLIKK